MSCFLWREINPLHSLMYFLWKKINLMYFLLCELVSDGRRGGNDKPYVSVMKESSFGWQLK